jgi:hypothetical protein
MTDTDRFKTTAARLFQDNASPAQLADALRREWLAGHAAGRQLDYTGRADSRAMAAERGLLIAKLQRRLAAARLRARVTRAAGPRLRMALCYLVNETGNGEPGMAWKRADALLTELAMAEQTGVRRVRGTVWDDPGPDGGAGLGAAGAKQDETPADA